tara:strand:- start:94 stop:249 length:156 start_codon:yes stop_codon:yes gene_type:complete
MKQVILIVNNQSNTDTKRKVFNIDVSQPKHLGEIVGYISACQDMGCEVEVI